MQKKFELELNQLSILTKYLEKIINEDCIVILRGDLASGKTTLVKNYVKALGLADLVTSPTFSLQAIYSNDIFHYDVYNKTLDKRIIKLYNLNDEYYTAKQLCSIIQNNKEYIFEVWDEEDNEVTQKRYELFLQGAHKFLDNI